MKPAKKASLKRQSARVILLSSHAKGLTKPKPLPPYRCACTQVKQGTAMACPVHWLALRLPEAHH